MLFRFFDFLKSHLLVLGISVLVLLVGVGILMWLLVRDTNTNQAQNGGKVFLDTISKIKIEAPKNFELKKDTPGGILVSKILLVKNGDSVDNAPIQVEIYKEYPKALGIDQMRLVESKVFTKVSKTQWKHYNANPATTDLETDPAELMIAPLSGNRYIVIWLFGTEERNTFNQVIESTAALNKI